MSRNLKKNSQKVEDAAQLLLKFTSKELEASYRLALKDIRAELSRLFEIYGIEGELTKAQAAQFLRQSNIAQNIVDIMGPYIADNEELLKAASMNGFDEGFYRSAWAIDQASGVSVEWGLFNDSAVRAACGIGGDPADLLGYMPEKEVTRHMKVMDNAFTNYGKDSRRWIQNDIRQGVIKGESASKVAQRLQKSGLMHSYNSAELIARTEILRSTGLGAQISYDEARDFGVNVLERWDAALDDRTRPDHAAADGTVKDNSTGMFSVPWGEVAGPRRSGIAAEDINCRCAAVPEIEGYSPEVRRIRDEGIQPYQAFDKWVEGKGWTRNRYGQKYNFG